MSLNSAAIARENEHARRHNKEAVKVEGQEPGNRERVERAERLVSFVMRLGISMVMPAWALAMLIVGIEWRSPWWIVCGLAVGGVGVLFLAGSPLTDAFLRNR